MKINDAVHKKNQLYVYLTAENCDDSNRGDTRASIFREGHQNRIHM